jgi:hypothetical protein
VAEIERLDQRFTSGRPRATAQSRASRNCPLGRRAACRSDSLSERVRGSLEAVTDLGEFSRSEVDALLLGVRALPKVHELVRHVLDSPSELGQLFGDARYVVLGCHPTVIVGTITPGRHPVQDAEPLRSVRDHSAPRACSPAEAQMRLSWPCGSAKVVRRSGRGGAKLTLTGPVARTPAEARRLPTRSGARDEGASANRVRLRGQAPSSFPESHPRERTWPGVPHPMPRASTRSRGWREKLV